MTTTRRRNNCGFVYEPRMRLWPDCGRILALSKRDVIAAAERGEIRGSHCVDGLYWTVERGPFNEWLYGEKRLRCPASAQRSRGWNG